MAEGTGVRFGVLGPVTAWQAEGEVALRGRRQRALLAALLTAPGQAVTADALIDVAWGDDLPDDPRAALHTAMSRLRSRLGHPSPLRTGPAGYAVTVPATAVDAGEFEALVATAAGRPPAEAATLLGRALGLWRGPAFGDVAELPAIQPTAARLEERRRVTEEALAEALLAAGRPHEALEAAGRALDGDPLRERAVELQLRALYRLGRSTEALDRLRGLREALAEELGVDPSPRLRELEVAILRHDVPDDEVSSAAPPSVAAARPGWRPSTTAFVGRDTETAMLLELLGSHRLVTVTGAGGVGKTRLVAEALDDPRRPAGRRLTVVELRGVEGGDVALTIAAALAISADRDDLTSAIVEYLAPEAHLLVLDNCEHVVAEVRPIVAALLRTPDTQVLTTSRRRLGLPHERLLPIAPLPLPAADDRGAAAAVLVLDRATALRPDLTVADDEWPLLVDLCRRLDGLPLALELAATRIATLGLAAVHDRLDRVLDLLGEPSSAAGRTRDLRGVLEWSHQLLHPAERVLFACLAVLEGPVELAAVEAVAPDPARAARDLAALVDAGLVGRDPDGRFRQLDLVRRFAAEKLAGLGEDVTADLRRRHATWCAALVTTAAADVTGPGDHAAFARVDAHRAEVLAAVRWAAGHDVDLAATVGAHLGLLGHFRMDAGLAAIVRRAAEAAVGSTTPAAALAAAAAARSAAFAGDLDVAAELAAQVPADAAPLARYLASHALAVVHLYRGATEAGAAAVAEGLAVPGLPAAHVVDLHVTGALLASYAGDGAAALQQAAAASAVAEGAGAVAYRAVARYVEGECRLGVDREAAVAHLQAAVALADASGATFVSGIARTSLVSVLIRVGRTHEAAPMMVAVLRHWRRARAWPQLWTSLRLTAELLVALGHDAAALLLLDAADRAPLAPAVTGADRDRLDDRRRLAADRLDATTRAAVAAQVAALSPLQVVERAWVALGAAVAGERAT